MVDSSGGNWVPRKITRACAFIAACLLSVSAFAGGTYYTNSDNENDAETGVADGDMDVTVNEGGHIEFNINVVTPPTTSAVLTIYANDVDEEQGEIDDVFLNGTHLGRLSGANAVWSSTVFQVDPSLLHAGNNKVRVDVSTGGGGWVVNVDWGQLLIDGGAADRGDTGRVAITGYSIAGGTVTVNTSANVHSISGGTYRLEMSIVAPNGDSASVLSQTFTAAADTDVVRTASPTYAIGSATGTYTVQAQLFYMDGGFPVQQDVATTQFVHTQNVGITDADNDGLTETEEQTLGTDRFNVDTDGDGEDDATEVGSNVNAPLNADSDALIDALDSSTADSDNDGVNNEIDAGNNNPCVPNSSHAQCLAADSDGDGLTNAQEDTLGTNRNSTDSDGDGVSDGTEVGNVNSPTDSDGDGVINALESSSVDSDSDGTPNQTDADNMDPCVPNSGSTPCLALDSDSDGLTNGQEDTLGTDRTVADSDGDGEDDGAEVGTPASPLDTDNDDVIDALESSVIDTDGDGVPNETDSANNYACSPNSNSASCLTLDSDGDGINNGDEDALGTSRGVADTDGDGTTDSAEVGNMNAPNDLDGDGLIDALESSLLDADNDGTPNQSDSADTNPCVPNGSNAACLAADSDGDGLTNAEEDALGTDRDSTDTDDDGIADAVEVGGDPAHPTDSDNDGVSDALENGANDSDNDGIVDSSDADSDNDGIPDSVETTNGMPRDTDGDGIPDHLDRDSDNDSLPDTLEAGNGGTPRDTDNDGIADYLDADSDGDGVADRLEGNGRGTDSDRDGIDDAFDADTLGEADMNHDGIGDSAVLRDSDNDGTPDFLDADADGDGIADRFEAGISGHDSDGDGIDDSADADFTGGADSNGDGIDDTYTLADHDGDGVPDMFDLDSDNDGVSDVVEADIADLDHDGRADSTIPQATAPVDSDGDGAPDYLDLDSDGDGTFDIVGSGGVDTNGDGRIDAGPDSDNDGIPDASDPAPRVPGTYRDSDGDGVVDAIDVDLDNDGIRDDVEGTDDSDGDGIPNLADLDSDNDGLPDLIEAGGVDANGDGIVDDLADSNGNGLADVYDTAAGNSALPVVDTDGDGFADFRDVDSDGDGISDLLEAGGTDADGDGHIDVFVDADHDGLADSVDATKQDGHALVRSDTDRDGIFDGLDTDSDGDGVSDRDERNADSDHDGIPDFRDQPGKLGTAVNGAGAFDLWWLLAAGALLAWRRRQTMAKGLAPLAAILALSSQAQAEEASEFYISAEVGITTLKPENQGGGYVVDDDSSAGFRLVGGYAWSSHWGVEVFYADAGKAGIASDNRNVGHLGDIEYKMYGAGLRWAPLEEGTAANLYPVLKAGVATIRNEASDARIRFDRENSVGFYVGVGGAWRFLPSWTLQAELTSYDKDDRFMSLGIRWGW